MTDCLQQRLKQAMEHARVGKAELARGSGVSHSSVWAWLNGRSREMTAGNAQRVAARLGVNAEWLATGRGEMTSSVAAVGEGDPIPPGAVAIPEYRVRFGAGAQEPPSFEEEHDACPAYYRRQFFVSKGISPRHCRRFRVRGDSMLPVLFDGDTILVDCTPGQQVVTGRIYAFTYAGELRVKRLYPRLDGSLLLKSENPDIPDESIPASDMDRVGLVGRVLDRSGAGPF